MELQVFNSTEFGSVRTATVNGEVMFVGKDVASILGYQNGSRDINRHVDEEDRHKVMLFDGNQDKETIIINESGLYSLILSSKIDRYQGINTNLKKLCCRYNKFHTRLGCISILLQTRHIS